MLTAPLATAAADSFKKSRRFIIVLLECLLSLRSQTALSLELDVRGLDQFGVALDFLAEEAGCIFRLVDDFDRADRLQFLLHLIAAADLGDRGVEFLNDVGGVPAGAQIAYQLIMSEFG